ncbi:MAG TPA: hypothetical protein VFW87_27360, partial [Pirellulales bacterium]|nr:hypothetical protein [Pirellulales bacterium]
MDNLFQRFAKAQDQIGRSCDGRKIDVQQPHGQRRRPIECSQETQWILACHVFESRVERHCHKDMLLIRQRSTNSSPPPT